VRLYNDSSSRYPCGYPYWIYLWHCQIPQWALYQAWSIYL
jgi:hypothetical protein